MHLYTGALSLIRSSLFSSRPATLISRAPVNIRYETTFVPPVHPSTLSQGCFQFFRNFFFLCEFFFFFLLLRIYIYTRNASPFHNRAAPNRFGLRDHKFGKRRYESVRAYLFVDIIRFARNFVFCIFFFIIISTTILGDSFFFFHEARVIGIEIFFFTLALIENIILVPLATFLSNNFLK